MFQKSNGVYLLSYNHEGRFYQTYSLPSNVMEAKPVNSFERRLDKLWRDQPVYYNYREAINPTGYDKKTQSLEESELVQQVVTDLLPEGDLWVFVSIISEKIFVQSWTKSMYQCIKIDPKACADLGQHLFSHVKERFNSIDGVTRRRYPSYQRITWPLRWGT